MVEARELLANGGGNGDRGVTVVIPSYEEWPMLERTLACVEADARRLDRPCQVVIVDNGSSTGTRRKIRRFARESRMDVDLVLRTGLGGVHFRPGTARNIGVEHARYDQVVFFDADCAPAADTLKLYCRGMDVEPETVFLGHREFVDAAALGPEEIASDRDLLSELPPIRSSSNYKQALDRRLHDLRQLDRHQRPYDCLHGCNFALSRAHFRSGVWFDDAYDGAWGYEDIDLGYQLHQRGLAFRYLADAFVYHQEPNAPADPRQRNDDRLRNILILDAKVGDFIAYRERSGRVCPLPRGIAAGAAADLGAAASHPGRVALPLPNPSLATS
jgi:cellulose synthase/poly-beta-1,6-N-acetylglucosamine synthase-like glycosyltransferase